MAENENGQEKSEAPTGKRVRDAREKGQIARSRELNTVVVLLAGATSLLLFGGYFGTRIANLMTDALDLERGLIFDPALMITHLAALIERALLILAPLFMILVVVALLGPLLIGGINFSSQAITPKFSKLNPITGIKKVFSVTGLMELVKGIGKFVLVALVAGLAIKVIWGTLLALGDQPVEQAIIQTGRMAAWVFLIASIALIAVAAIDVPFQIWNHTKQLKMTLQEVKDEFKETEGKPEVKGRIRQLQMEASRRRMMTEVPKADVVITNPTHYAVALQYQPATMRAPRLLAKGTDATAKVIREIAEEHQITLVEAPRVARAIYFTTDLDQDIPGGLFVAVARILAYVYQLKRDDLDVDLPDELPVPDEYLDPQSARRARR
ncbi:flagellar biosynthetic protein FlhB [Thiorhodococcus drewsii AZ1]|uniref:Flagellar biosynthetic protein FlhB n=1 Tax=Thiorhodococcus drewsii AZ1 TaxID=765913 RepID=G2E346_9GAMM|nr:flagellar biosynthesis protein FlhB [Thiorhodococcus drewsii]EGV30508.1 flagellar biosynthetic protein FlhB [Thiorhodococcus drewsii AZ1]